VGSPFLEPEAGLVGTRNQVCLQKQEKIIKGKLELNPKINKSGMSELITIFNHANMPNYCS
jgi:hypothetical protein